VRNNRRNVQVKFTFTCTQGNTTITGVPLGGIGMWVAKMGGDDLCIEELIYFGEAYYNEIKFNIYKEEASDDK